MNKKLIREYVRLILNEKSFIGNMNARMYFDSWDTYFQSSVDLDVKKVKIQRASPSVQKPNPPPQYGIKNPTVRLMVNLDPTEWKSKSKDEVWKKMAEITVKALSMLPNEYDVNVVNSTPRLLTQGSGTYPSIKAKIGTMEYLIIMNPGFKVSGGSGTAGPGEPEMESAGVDARFQKRVEKGGSWTVIFGDSPKQKFHDVVKIKKWTDSTSTGEPKTDILLLTSNGKQINFSLKGINFPSYEGLSPSRVKAFEGTALINCIRLQFVLNSLTKAPKEAVKLLDNTRELIIDLESLGGTQLYPLPAELAIPIVYGTKQTGGPVDYVIKVKDGVSLEGDFDDVAGTITFPNMKIAAKNPQIPPGDTPVIAFRTATGKVNASGKSSRRVEASVDIDGKPFTVIINKCRQMVVPGPQRNKSENATLIANTMNAACNTKALSDQLQAAISNVLSLKHANIENVNVEDENIEDVNDQQISQDTY